jgi:bile acid-coenzyme A ligase
VEEGIEVSEEGTPLGTELDRLATEAPDRPAIIFRDESISRMELSRRSNRLARYFGRLGVGAGDVVSVGLPNVPRFIESVAALWKLGAVPHPISHRLPAGELAGLVQLADPVLVVGLEDGSGRPWLPPNFELPDGMSDEPLPPQSPPVWKITSSSGSTGKPKLIISTSPSGSVEGITRSASQWFRIEREETFLCTAPLFHGASFTFSFMALLLGATIVQMEKFDALESLRLIERYRATWVYLVPTMMHRILRLPEEDRLGVDMSSVRVAYHGGAPCPPAVKRAWIDWLGADVVFEVYGAVEGQATTTVSGQEWMEHPGSVGRLVTGEIRVQDESGNVLPPGEIGELWVRPEGGRRPYRYVGAEVRERNGWETIGDMGWVDQDDYVYLADRRTDMVLVGGANVYPAEVEGVLLEHPDVISACVIGLPDEDLGNRIHAIIETGRKDRFDGELRALAGSRLSRHKTPRCFEYTDAPLRDDTGKIRRSALREARLVSQGPEDRRWQ